METGNSKISDKLAVLKSGTDLRFNAISFEQNIKNIDEESLVAIAGAFSYWLSEKYGSKELRIAVGHDSRVSAENIKSIVIKTLLSCGVDVPDCGLCSTPSMFFMTKNEITHADGSIMITASHHPFYKNGLKFFTRQGGLESTDISKLLEYATLRLKADNKNKTGDIITGDFLSLYTESLVEKIRSEAGGVQPLKNLKIVVDAGNGAGGFFADKVLKPLGADTSGSVFLEPDGMFPNHVPNPEDSKAMESISQAVLKSKADFGIIFDTDVDRAACVASDGKEINRNKLIALICAVILKKEKNATIVTDSITSEGLTVFIESIGGVHHRFKRGYKNVINEAIALNNQGKNSPLAIETSGHAAFRENDFLDDGAYLIVKILIELCKLNVEGKDILSLIKTLREPTEEAEVRLGFTTDAWKALGDKIIQDLKKIKNIGWTAEKVNYEGVRIKTATGNFTVRMSVHDPVMPINFEDYKKGGVKNAALELYEHLRKYNGLDLSNLVKFLK